jgi:hypothetical protein
MTHARVKSIRSPLTSFCSIACLQNMEKKLKPREFRCTLTEGPGGGLPPQRLGFRRLFPPRPLQGGGANCGVFTRGEISAAALDNFSYAGIGVAAWKKVQRSEASKFALISV